MIVTIPGSTFIEGIDLALAQARTLIADARCLLDAGRFATAGVLPILAIGEVGKAALIRDVLLHFNRNTDWPKFWDDLGNHERKVRAFYNLGHVFNIDKRFAATVGIPLSRDKLIASGRGLENVSAIVRSRLESLYCHFDEDEDGFVPCKAMEPDITRQILPFVERGALMVDYLLLSDLESGLAPPSEELVARRRRVMKIRTEVLNLAPSQDE